MRNTGGLSSREYTSPRASHMHTLYYSDLLKKPKAKRKAAYNRHKHTWTPQTWIDFQAPIVPCANMHLGLFQLVNSYKGNKSSILFIYFFAKSEVRSTRPQPRHTMMVLVKSDQYAPPFMVFKRCYHFCAYIFTLQLGNKKMTRDSHEVRKSHPSCLTCTIENLR